MATAGKFHATFDDNNRIQALHGWPNSRIVSTTPGEPDKTSTADKLDVTFAPDGGAQKLIQTGDFAYHEPPPNPTPADAPLSPTSPPTRPMIRCWC